MQIVHVKNEFHPQIVLLSKHSVVIIGVYFKLNL